MTLKNVFSYQTIEVIMKFHFKMHFICVKKATNWI